jgi:AcrR family transcriptional regulator
MVSKLMTKSKETTGTADLILDCAKEALRQHGFKRMTMDDLATRAGVGKGTLYLYFPSKDDVALSVIDRGNLRLQERLKSMLKQPGSAKMRLRAMIVERVMYRFECASGYQNGIDELLAVLRPQLHERRERYHKAESLILAEILIEGRTLGEFSIEEPFVVSDAIITATASLLPYSLSPQQLGEEEQLRNRVEALADLLLKAIETRTHSESQTSRQNRRSS